MFSNNIVFAIVSLAVFVSVNAEVLKTAEVKDGLKTLGEVAKHTFKADTKEVDKVVADAHAVLDNLKADAAKNPALAAAVEKASDKVVQLANEIMPQVNEAVKNVNAAGGDLLNKLGAIAGDVAKAVDAKADVNVVVKG